MQIKIKQIIFGLTLIFSTVIATLFFSGFFDKKIEAYSNLQGRALPSQAIAKLAIENKESKASNAKQEYLQIDKEFTVKINSSQKIMTIQVAIMTLNSDRLFVNLKKHEFTMRDLVLKVMKKINEDDVMQPDFRSKLAAKILKTLNDELIKSEGHGDIEDVFFTSFIVQ